MTRLIVRRALLAGVLAAAVAGAGLAIWRTAAPRPETADTIAAQLRCPACQGESVARSSSPIAAAMREVIAAQLAEGRSPEQVRQWLVDRYGASLLSDPPTAGWGLVLWLVPAAATAIGVVVLARRLRRGEALPRGGRTPLRRGPTPVCGGQARTAPARPRSGQAQPRGALTRGALARTAPDAGASARDAPARRSSDRRPSARHGPDRRARARSARAGRTWDLLAVSTIALAGVVALASPSRDPAPAVDPLADSLSLASSLEGQERFAEAAAIYREVAESQPTSAIRLRLAYCLLRSGQPADAADAAAGVLADDPDNPQAVLLLGLAQRAQGLAEAATTLQRFLELDPDNEAAPQVRRLLEQTPP